MRNYPYKNERHCSLKALYNANVFLSTKNICLTVIRFENFLFGKKILKKCLTNQKVGCIIRHIEGNGVFKFYLEVPLSHFKYRKKAKASFVFLRRTPYLF